MVGLGRAALAWCACVCFSAALAGASTEYNPVRREPVAIGPEAARLVIGFRATAGNAVVRHIHIRFNHRVVTLTEAQTTPNDVASLAQRVALHVANSRQLTSSMHVVFLQKTLYGADVTAVLAALRADPAVKFAEVDQWRYPHAVPNDPLFIATPGAAGQWYMMTPSAGGDAAATDAVSAWSITTGSSGIVIADVDTGVRFDHPDLLRAGFGGRLLPGYDFVSGDLTSTGGELGTYLIANDGDGWDPDPSDPGDWINSTDQTNALFPATSCPIADSSWHGTRVMGILGALTNNDVGIAGMTWDSYLLPVRALGKCGGYDSDIIAGMEWAAGMTTNGVPDNPNPASIINLSLGGSGACPTDYADAVSTLTQMGVLIVASAGNASGPVEAPANCAGVLGVAGLRNVGTKVGYSSFGPEVGVAAPAGNCVTSSGACLKSIDTTSNTGLTVPSTSTYTNETNANLGTSFSAPIVSGIAALMRSVNANLTPAQLIARIEASAVAFPQPTGLPVCPTLATDGSEECACPSTGGECGSGMVNALNAVTAAERPIAAVVVPALTQTGESATLDASGSAASCGRTVASYAWTPSGGVTLSSGGAAAQAVVVPTGTAGTVTLTVTDSAGAVDTAVLSVSAGGVITAAAGTPSTAGAGDGACPAAGTFAAVPPTVAATFSPANVNPNVASTLTLTLGNSNGFDLTQTGLTATLPTGLVQATASSSTTSVSPATTCTGSAASLTVSGGSVALSGAIIPASGSCTVTVPVQGAAVGSYTDTVAAAALTTAPAGANTDSASATLSVTAPSKSGGGALDWWDTLFVVGVLLAGRRHAKRGPRRY